MNRRLTRSGTKWILLAAGALALTIALAGGEGAASARPASEGSSSFERFWGPFYRLGDVERVLEARRVRRPPANTLARVKHWNKIAIDTSGVDHTPLAAGEQRGPGRASRAMAIVHIAIFDAMNAIAGGYRGYSGILP